MASHDAMRKKLGHVLKETINIAMDTAAPQPIYEDRHDLVSGKMFGFGMPVYIGGAGAGLAVVATGGTLAVAAIVGATGAAVGAGIGTLISHAIASQRKRCAHPVVSACHGFGHAVVQMRFGK